MVSPCGNDAYHMFEMSKYILCEKSLAISYSGVSNKRYF